MGSLDIDRQRECVIYKVIDRGIECVRYCYRQRKKVCKRYVYRSVRERESLCGKYGYWQRESV